MAKQIHPIGFSGRLEAIRAPTRGKARKGNTKTNTTLKPPVPQLLGGCAGWLNKYNAMLAANKSSERPASDQAFQEAARRVLIPPTP